MKTLSEAQEDIGISVKPRVNSTSTAQHGLTKGDGKASGLPVQVSSPLQSLQPSQAQDILSKMRSVKPWQIKLEDQKAAKNALPLLELALIQTTYEDSAYWIGRLLAHFPRRDTTKDGIVIADLAADLLEDEVSHTALISACDELRRESTEERPFMPPSGEIVLRARNETERYIRWLKYLSQDYEEVKTKNEIEKNINGLTGFYNNPQVDRRRIKASKLLHEKPFGTWTKWERKFVAALGKYREQVTAESAKRRMEKYGVQVNRVIDENSPF